MSLSAQNLRSLKEAITTRIAAVSGIGEILPSRMTFESKAAYINTVKTLTTQKTIEQDPVALCLVYLLSPFGLSDPLAQGKVIELQYAVSLFREHFETRVDEADDFEKKLLSSEDTFDAACVGVGEVFSSEITGIVLSADYKANFKPIEAEEDIQFGVPDFINVEGSYMNFILPVEIDVIC